jgi:hypothetical protein
MIVGAEAGLLVTNISTEIAGITLAVRMIEKTTSSLPDAPNAPNARFQWLADHILNKPHPPGEEEPPPSFTILSDCQYAIDACLLYAPPPKPTGSNPGGSREPSTRSKTGESESP